MTRRITYLLCLAALTLGFLTACSGSQEPARMRLGLLPILDALPMYVAEDQGYFAEQGVEVEFIPVSSAAERDQLMQAGQIDGMINDLVSTMIYNRESQQIVVVRFARTATADFPQYRILAAGSTDYQIPADLARVPIGVSEGTVIEYTTDRLLEIAGLTPDEIVTLAVPSIPDRMSLLNSGELEAANLPDPLASLAIQNGARVVIDDTTAPEIGNSLISFRASYVQENPDAIRGFLAAVERATADINADKDRWSDVLVERNLVPEPLLGSYAIPDFPTASVPSEAQFADVLQWTQSEGIVETEVDYALSVDESYLP